MQAVAACLFRYVRQNQSLVVAYSGGLDSTVLLHAANRLAGGVSCDLSALHVHHGLSANADAWAESCTSVCRALDIPLTVIQVDVPRCSGEGIEAAARRVRHQAFDAAPADWILLAHHADDQAETVLHNLLRGAGVRGAAAMPEVRGRQIRPLLGLRRANLLTYAKRHRLTWIDDESNTDTRFTRNFLRREILPAISSRFPRASEHLAAAAGLFGEADSLLDDLARLDLGESPAEFPLPRKLFTQMPDSRARNLLRAMLKWHHVQPPDAARLAEFVRQLLTAGSDRHPRIDLERYSLWCEAGKLHFRNLV
ncbi:MAG: tRNA lysidine(34) synthetase TilS [Pseudomonadota bacterium]